MSRAVPDHAARPCPTGERADLLVADGVIAEVGRIADAAGATVVDADGLIALPGLVDLHTHLREPGYEQSETVLTGTRAAAAGGFTAVFAMANTSPVADTAGVVEQELALGDAAGYVTVQPIGAVTVGLKGERLAELGAMADSRASVRVFSDDGFCVSDPLLMRRALEYVKAFDGVIAQHAQEPRLTAGRPDERGRPLGRARPRRLARRRRGVDHRARRAARRARRLPPARLPRLDRRIGRGHPLGEGARRSTSPPRSPRTTCCSPRSSSRATTRASR